MQALGRRLVEKLKNRRKEKKDMADNKKPDFYVLREATGVQKGQFASAVSRTCCICDHTVDHMGGPGSGTVCVECRNLLCSGRLKIDREHVLAALED